jgi:prepilin-type N-terminal cleavage/methylation domain-containing protein
MKKQCGLTLIEMIITIVVLGALGALGASMFVDAFRASSMVNSGQATADQARYAVERMGRELREVKYANGYQLTSGVASGVNTVTFVNGSNVTVTIARSGAQLNLAYSSPAVSATLANNVTNFQLDFKQLDNSAATSTSDVRFVVITLTVRDAENGLVVSQQTRVALRNA